MIKCIFVFLSLFFFAGKLTAQVPKTTELYKTLKENDSLLFDIGFNKCDISQFENLVSGYFEFYHDQSGITHTKSGFISGIKNGLCNLPYKPERKLDEASLEVFPLYNRDTLYGAIQNGTHRFFAIEKDGTKYLTSTARFSHLWLLENGQWKFSRGLSFDHKDFEKPVNGQLLFKDKDETNRWLQQKQIPALGIGYIQNGTIKQISVFGTLEKDKAAPVNTIWNVASLTKPITALVALKLIDQGKWSLDEPLCKYYTDPDVAGDPFSEKLTTRIILSHQTGFPNWRKDNKNGTLNFSFEPGTQYKYSGEGYEYLRRSLEKKFGKTLDQLADELIFKPLKMHNTCFYWNKKTEETRFAKWHKKNGETYPVYYNSAANAADDLLTTIEDYTKFVLYVMNGAGLSQTLQSQMTAVQVRINDHKHFGLGWWIDENINADKDFAMVHGGDDIGVHTIAFIIPKSKNGLVIFTNSDNGTDAFTDILLKYLGKDGQGILAVETK